MYNEYWGFKRSPFSGQLDPERFYESPIHEEALARLVYVLDECRQGALILGPPGVGKSLLVETFARRCRRPDREIALARCPAFDARELFFELAQEFRLAPDQRATEAELWRLLRDHVIANRIEQHQTVIVVDQAHLLAQNPLQLRALNLLFHLDSDPAARLTLILVARPELLQNARSDVTAWVDLGVLVEPFPEEQTALYISHLTAWAGRSARAFAPEAIHKIHELTGGIARQINRVCDLALLAAASDELELVSAAVVESVYQELNPEVTARQPSLAV